MFGTSIHLALQFYLKIMYLHGPKAADAIDINQYFKQRISDNYKKTRLLLGRLFTDILVIDSYFRIGKDILLYFKKYRTKYFKYNNTLLLGILKELLYLITPNVFFKGFIDIVIRDKKTNIIKIIDFKTSQRGWKEKDKKDLIKKAQLLLYKKFYSEQFNVDINNIAIEYIILKKEVLKYGLYNLPRIQLFLPANKKPSIKKSLTILLLFINSCISDGLYIKNVLNYPVTKNASNCKYCPYYYKNSFTEGAMVCEKWDKKYKRIVINENIEDVE